MFGSKARKIRALEYQVRGLESSVNYWSTRFTAFYDEYAKLRNENKGLLMQLEAAKQPQPRDARGKFLKKTSVEYTLQQ